MDFFTRVCGLFVPITVVVAVSFGRCEAVAQAAAPPNMQLRASPALADVGSNVAFTLTAGSWPAPASVGLTFVSPHHGFSGTMTWVTPCNCFQVAVHLAPRVHPVEQGLVTATVKSGSSTSTVRTTFTIRGLAPDGRTLAPGGTTLLSGWVSDPTPVAQQVEHFCAWATTADGLGVAGLKVGFKVRYADRVQSWNGGKTSSTGLACSNRSIGNAQAGRRVRVDIIAGSLHATTFFTPRA